jgi:hypothetical protein
MFHHVEDAFDEAGDCFTTFQWKPAVHSLFEIAEKTQINALKYMSRMWRESYDLHVMISQHL